MRVLITAATRLTMIASLRNLLPLGALSAREAVRALFKAFVQHFGEPHRSTVQPLAHNRQTLLEVILPEFCPRKDWRRPFSGALQYVLISTVGKSWSGSISQTPRRRRRHA
jgi:hypothetical protein